MTHTAENDAPETGTCRVCRVLLISRFNRRRGMCDLCATTRPPSDEEANATRRRLMQGWPIPPVLSDLPKPTGNHCRGCGWSSGEHDLGCPIPPGSDLQ